MLFHFTVEEGVQDILWDIVIEAAVVIVYLVADKGVIGFKQCVDDVNSFLMGNTENKPFVYFAHVTEREDHIYGKGT